MNTARVLRYLPSLIRSYWRIASSPASAEVVASELESVHRLGLSSTDSRYRLAVAYTRLERWQEALDEFARIYLSRLSAGRTPWFRYYRAFALARTGKYRDARLELDAIGVPPERMARDKEELERYLTQVAGSPV